MQDINMIIMVSDSHHPVCIVWIPAFFSHLVVEPHHYSPPPSLITCLVLCPFIFFFIVILFHFISQLCSDSLLIFVNQRFFVCKGQVQQSVYRNMMYFPFYQHRARCCTAPDVSPRGRLSFTLFFKHSEGVQLVIKGRFYIPASNM